MKRVLTVIIMIFMMLLGCQNEAVQSGDEKIVYVDRTGDVIEKIIYRDRSGDVIYVDRTIDVEKIIYVDRTIDISQGGQGGQDTKITSLQFAINTAKPSDVIDFTDPKYSTITTIEPSIGINKAVTIKNFDNLGGAQLNIGAEGVILSNVGKASVNTNSSLKISGSSLSSLNICAVDLGRGESTKPRPPRVELLSSDVSSDVVIGLDNAALTIHDVSADKIKFNADNTQLTVEDSSSVINRFETDKDCKVVLEDGTSDTIPCVLDKMDIGAHGKLTQVNMQAAESLILTKLSPESGLITTMKEDESIDFSQLEVIGTYMATGAVTVFTAKLTYDLQSTFTKKEKDFSIKIDGSLAYKRENGAPVDTGYVWSSLEAGYHNAVIEKNDFPDKAEDYAYETMLTVYEKQITPVLVSIEADTTYAHTEYLNGETLDLSDLIVRGVYEVNSTFAGTTSYTEEISNYTQNISNGTVLTANKSVVISYQGKTATVSITVIPSCVVTLHYGYKTESFLIAKGTKMKELFISSDRAGYTNGGKINSSSDEYYKPWHTEAHPSNNDNAYEFENGYSTLNVNNDLHLYVAPWKKSAPFSGAIVYIDKTTADQDNDKYIYVAEPISGETAMGVVFLNRHQLGGDDGYRIVSLTESNNLLWCSNNSDLFNRSVNYGLNINTSLEDGSNNWTMIRNNNYVSDENTSGRYPAFEYVNSLSPDDPAYPWYMPSRAELLNLIGGFLNGLLNSVFEKLNITKIDTVNNIYWSSSCAGKKEWSQGDWGLGVYCSAKTDQNYNPDYNENMDAGVYFEVGQGIEEGDGVYYKSAITNAKVRTIRKFKYQSSTTGDNRYTYQ